MEALANYSDSDDDQSPAVTKSGLVTTSGIRKMQAAPAPSILSQRKKVSAVSNSQALALIGSSVTSHGLVNREKVRKNKHY